MGLALYRKYRSRTLDEIVGQSHVTTLLSNAIKQNRVAHAYLFTGPRGVGKTSIARILAHEINQLPYSDESTHLDIIEIDAASNNGVDDIRDLRERVRMAPIQAAKKVYIIDEVHMLSKPAFNALLKTLEEPPEHVVFILATTDIDKVPETILSRTQRHSFKRASNEDIISNLTRIAKLENVAVDAEAFNVIAAHSDGSFRDSVSLLDQLLNSVTDKKSLSVEMVTSSLGIAAQETISTLLQATADGDLVAISETLKNLESQGTPPRTIAQQLMQEIRDKVASSSDLLPLLDSLQTISYSAYPELKLLTTLGLFNTTTLQAQPARVQKLSKPAASKPKHVSEPAKSPKQVHTPVEPIVQKAAPPKKTGTSEPFNWEALMAYVRTHHVAFYSMISKCEYEVDGDTLRLYTRTAFYKKKLDDTRYRALINGALEALNFPPYEIDTVPSTAPLKDSQAAKVAAIMGGGEEVTVEDDSK